MLRSPRRGDGALTIEHLPEAAGREDAELARRAAGGALDAFNQLVLRHQDAAYGLALRYLGSAEAAEDATQEAFVRAYRAIGGYRGGKFRSWLLTIVANVARDELRRRGRRPERSLDRALHDDPANAAFDPPDSAPSPEARAENAELRRALQSALRRLPDEWRLIVVLSDIQGHSHEEIARIAAVPIGTVKSRLSRARARLRDMLREPAEPPATAARHTGEAL